MSFISAKQKNRKAVLLVITACMVVCLCACGGGFGDTATPDPHEGMVSVSDGMGGQMWVPLYDDVPAASFSSSDFFADGAYIDYGGTQYEGLRGIDVSEHQGEIDWQAVRNDGVDFAIIRVGYRGYSEGKLFEDACFRNNIEGAIGAGLQVGIYFFSQAANAEEATEEAEFVLNTISGYGIDMPVYYDWERVANVGETRVDDVNGTILTECCLDFCDTIKNAGYATGVYFYRSLGYYDYDLTSLMDLSFWVGAPGDSPDFYYMHTMWQYSYTGAVSGIEGGTDLNILFIPKNDSVQNSAPSIVPGELTAPDVTMPPSE